MAQKLNLVGMQVQFRSTGYMSHLFLIFCYDERGDYKLVLVTFNQTNRPVTETPTFPTSFTLHISYFVTWPVILNHHYNLLILNEQEEHPLI